MTYLGKADLYFNIETEFSSWVRVLVIWSNLNRVKFLQQLILLWIIIMEKYLAN
jgi:hypothetical protein